MAPLRHLLVRALALYAIVCAALFVIRKVAFTSEGDFGASLGAVLLTCVLGTIDVARRGETLLWANLGFARIVTSMLFLLTAICAEIVLAVASR